MLFEQWSLLMDELKLEVLSKLIYSNGFPKSLLQVTSTSTSAQAFAKDFAVWQEAIRFYFPIIEKTYPEQYKQRPFECFKKTYIACSAVMAGKNVAMSDFMRAVQQDWKDVPVEKKEILLGLGLVVGFENKIDKKDITIQVKSYALLFATSLGLHSYIDKFMGLTLPAIASEFIREGLQYAAEFGHLTIFAYYLSNANARLDFNSKRSALIKAATNGHLAIIKVMVSTPGYWQGSVFALRKAVLVAAENGHAEVLKQLLTKLTLNTEASTLREALKIACQKGHTAAVGVILEQANAQMNPFIIISLLKLVAGKGEVGIVDLFFQHANKHISDATALEMLRNAMNEKHENVVLLILQKRHSQLSPYFKRQLFIEASNNGFASVIGFILENENASIGNTFKGQALKVAVQKNHLQIAQMLGKDEIDGLNDKIADLHLTPVKKGSFTPQYQNLRKSDDDGSISESRKSRTIAAVRI